MRPVAELRLARRLARRRRARRRGGRGRCRAPSSRRRPVLIILPCRVRSPPARSPRSAPTASLPGPARPRASSRHSRPAGSRSPRRSGDPLRSAAPPWSARRRRRWDRGEEVERVLQVHGRAGVAGEPGLDVRPGHARTRRPTARGRRWRWLFQSRASASDRPRRRRRPARDPARALGQQRRGRRIALGDPQRETIQQEVNRSRRIGARRRGASGLGHRPEDAGAVQVAGPDRAPRARPGTVSRDRSGVEGLEAPGRAEQQLAHRRWRVAARRRSVRAGAPPRPPQGVERAGLDRGQQPQRRVQRAGGALGPGGREQALGTASGVRRSAAPRARRNAAAAARPPRACARPAERSSSAATSSSGPAAAWARCQARRSGSSSPDR